MIIFSSFFLLQYLNKKRNWLFKSHKNQQREVKCKPYKVYATRACSIGSFMGLSDWGTSDAEDRRIRISHLRKRFKIVSSTARECQRNVSRQTISRRLKDYGLFCRRPAKKSRLTDRHKRTRLARATRYRRYTQQQWASVILQMSHLFQLKNVTKEKECSAGE